MTSESITKVPENTESVQLNGSIPQESSLVETQEQINWKKFREAREQDRKDKAVAEKIAVQKSAEAEALKAAMEALVSKPSNPSSNANNYDDESEEQRICRLVDDRLAKERLKQDEERAKRDHQEFPQRLKQSFSDFDQVCTTENLDYLEYHYPEIAEVMKKAPDGYDKWSAVYKAVKRFVPAPDSKKDAAKAEKNFNKPSAISSPGRTATGDAPPTMLDDAKREANWKRMQAVMKGAQK